MASEEKLMTRPSKAPQPGEASGFKIKYLRIYNASSAVLWSVVLIRILVLYPLVGAEFVSEGVSVFLSWTQSLAISEVIHAIFGIVGSNPSTVAMQVASRSFVVWGVVRSFPQSAATPFFSLMVISWCITELIRYPLYWAQLSNQKVPWLEWMRYNFFIVLYPIGATSEVILTYRALPAANFYYPFYSLLMKSTLIIYPPSFYMSYSHMFKMRHKVQTIAARKKQ